MDHEYDFKFLNSLPVPVFCLICNTRQFTLDPPCPGCERREKARDASFPLERFKCFKCKCFKPIADYPLDSRDFRAATCSACHTRRRDEYREQKGEVIPERRAGRFKRAQQVVEKALRERIRVEKRQKQWLEKRERWRVGEGGFTQYQIESFMLDDADWYGPLSEEDFAALKEAWKSVSRKEGPRDLRETRAALYKKREYRRLRQKTRYWQWLGYTDLREVGWEGWEEQAEEDGEEEQREKQGEDWEGYTDLQDGWGGYTGVEEGRTGVSEGYESFTDPQEGVQEQYCSSCNQKKPLTDFGRFFTCNSCRERNKRAKNARQAKHKASYVPFKATQEQLQYSLQALSKRSEFKLLLHVGSKTRPITVKDYLNKTS